MDAPTRDGRTLFHERHGDGAPVVVLESGMGFSRNEWGAVIPLVAERTTVVAYDRRGLGRSPRTDGPRDLDHLAADLVDLLAHLGDGPFVLVGHSWGGPIARVAASLVPDRIAGLVLVDQTDEGSDLFFGADQERQQRWGEKALPVMARLGLLRLVVRRQAKALPEPWASGLVAEDGTPASTREQLAELRSCTADLRRLRDHPVDLPDVPVTLISGTRDGFMERGRRGEVVEAHRARAAALPQGRHVRAERSSHYVPLTEPELVAREVLAIVERVRP